MNFTPNFAIFLYLNKLNCCPSDKTKRNANRYLFEKQELEDKFNLKKIMKLDELEELK
jgi:hypothetical protein